MKKLTCIFLIVSCYSAFAQKEQKRDSIVYEYNARWYNPSFCGCPPVKKDSLQVVKDTLKTEPIIFNKKYKRKKQYNRDISYYVKQKNPKLLTWDYLYYLHHH